MVLNLPRNAAIWAEGHEKGLAGDAPDCPYALNSLDGTTWFAGYVDAMKMRIDARDFIKAGIDPPV